MIWTVRFDTKTTRFDKYVGLLHLCALFNSYYRLTGLPNKITPVLCEVRIESLKITCINLSDQSVKILTICMQTVVYDSSQ